MTIREQMQKNCTYKAEWALLEVLFAAREMKRLDMPSDQAYKDDLDLVQDYQLKHSLNSFGATKLEEIGSDILQKEDGEKVNLDTIQKFITMLNHLRECLTDHIKTRLTASHTANVRLRLISLQTHLQLTAKETEAFAYMIYSSIGLNNSLNNSFKLSAFEEYCEMSLPEILDFVDENRRHIREAIVGLKQNGTSVLLDRGFHIAGEMITLMTRRPLSNEELLQIEGTVLEEVLAEEGIIVGVPVEVEENTANQGVLAPLEKSSSQVSDSTDFVLHDFLALEKADEPETPDKGHTMVEKQEDNDLAPYQDDQEYLGDQFAYFRTHMEYLEKQNEDERYSLSTEKSKSEILRDLKGKEKILLRKCQNRLQLTRTSGNWLPRLERLAEARQLDDVEKGILILLVGAVLDETFEKYLSGMRGLGSLAKVQDILKFFATTLKEQIFLRRYFYKDATLVREGMVSIEGEFTRDIQECAVDIDRKMLDYIAGLDTDLNNIVDGSQLYQPTVDLSHVVLPDEQKQMILETVRNYPRFVKNRKKYGLDNIIQYGKAIVILFHGPPGTGKTMMANALAHELGKKILLVNFPTLGSFGSSKIFSFLLRESTVHNALTFFDECDSILDSRDNGNKDITMFLTAIERHEGIVIMATNRAPQIDKAMQRRFTMDIEFKLPDPCLREQIWQEHLPPALPLAEDVDLRSLAVKYEFSGGYIKNAVLSALSIAGSRSEETPVISMADLEHGSRLQMRSYLGMGDFDRRVVPKFGIESLVLAPNIQTSLQEVIHFEKARNVLFGQWGFEDVMSYGVGNGVLFHGAPGTGKTMAAEAIGYEIGRPLLVVNMAELLSKYVGESAKNIEGVFSQARNHNCILVFDEAEGLFAERTNGGSATDRYANIDVNLLLHHMERFPGMVILTTNLIDNIDEAIFRRLKFILEFKKPDRSLRHQIWQQLIPGKAPVADDIDFTALAKQYEFTGGNIKNCIFKAAARAALRPAEERQIQMIDLLTAAGEEYGVGREKKIGF